MGSKPVVNCWIGLGGEAAVGREGEGFAIDVTIKVKSVVNVKCTIY